MWVWKFLWPYKYAQSSAMWLAGKLTFFCWDVVRLDKTDGVFAPNQAFFNGSYACGLCAEVRQQAGSWHCSKNEF
jgi:hypothetical protein